MFQNRNLNNLYKIEMHRSVKMQSLIARLIDQRHYHFCLYFSKEKIILVTVEECPIIL